MNLNAVENVDDASKRIKMFNHVILNIIKVLTILANLIFYIMLQDKQKKVTSISKWVWNSWIIISVLYNDNVLLCHVLTYKGISTLAINNTSSYECWLILNNMQLVICDV
jgi:hypothetical protein